MMENPQNCLLKSHEILKKWREKCHPQIEFVTAGHCRRILKKDLNFSFKKNALFKPGGESLLNKKKRRDFVLQMIMSIEDNKEFIFLDESAFNLEGKRSYGWHKKGKPFFIEARNRSINYTLIAAITRYNLVGFMIVQGYLNSVTFLGFLYELINHLKNDTQKEIKNYVLQFIINIQKIIM